MSAWPSCAQADAPEDYTLKNPDTVTKYRTAGDIANRTKNMNAEGAGTARHATGEGERKAREGDGDGERK